MKWYLTIKVLVPIAVLAGIVALAAVACGGGDDEDTAAASPLAAAAAPAQEVALEPSATTAEPTATEVPKVRYKGGLVPADQLAPVDLSKEGAVVDLTVKLHDGPSFYGAPPNRYEPKDMTFRVGQTVNFTLEFADVNSRYKHTFTSTNAFDHSQPLGIDWQVSYGQSATFTYTFDKPDFSPYIAQSLIR